LDEDHAALPDRVDRFYIGLGCHCDRAGRCEDRPLKLRAQIMPYYADFDAEEALAILAKPRRSGQLPFIIRYEVDGERFIQVVDWHKEQRPHPNEKESEIPDPPEGKGMDNKRRTRVKQKKDKGHTRVDGDGDSYSYGDGDRDGDGDRKGDRGKGDPNAPPAPSRGSGSASPDGLAEPCLSNKPLLSESTIRGFLEIKSKSEVLAMLRKGGYPIPEFLLGGPAAEEEGSPSADPPEKKGQGHAEE